MNFYKQYLLLFFVFQSLFFREGFSFETSALLDKTTLSTKIEKALHENRKEFHGVILIRDEDGIYYQKAFGKSDRETGTPMAINSQFCVGSLVKQITAALIIKASDESLLRLSDPIAVYLPDLQQQLTSKVTIHHLLNHTSGITSLHQPLAFEPGTQFSYSNTGYDILGTILERTYNKPRAEIFLKTFEQLHMRSSFLPSCSISFQDLRKTHPLLSQGYAESPDGSLLPNETILDPSKSTSGGMISTVQDLHTWTTTLFKGHVVHSIQPMVTPSATRNHRYSNALGYGYGIQISKEKSIYEISHSGYVPGFISSLLYYPDYGLSVIVLENSSWSTDDIKRCFFIHDEIRKIIRENLVAE